MPLNCDDRRNPLVRGAGYCRRMTSDFGPMTLRCKTAGVGLRLVEAFARRRNGGVTEEFAALVPLFIGLIFTIAQIGLYFYYSASLYYVTHAAARQILTGGVANQNLTAA